MSEWLGDERTDEEIAEARSKADATRALPGYEKLVSWFFDGSESAIGAVELDGRELVDRMLELGIESSRHRCLRQLLSCIRFDSGVYWADGDLVYKAFGGELVRE